MLKAPLEAFPADGGVLTMSRTANAPGSRGQMSSGEFACPRLTASALCRGP